MPILFDLAKLVPMLDDDGGGRGGSGVGGIGIGGANGISAGSS